MSVPAKAFQQWLNVVTPGTTMTAVSSMAGIKRSTLAQQLVRGKVAVSTVISISRALKLDVLQSLAGFDRYRELSAGSRPPTDAELISQISDIDLLQQILLRNAAAQFQTSAPAQPLGPLPHATSVRNWIAAIDTVDLRPRILTDLRMAAQNFSAQLSANRLRPDIALAAARLSGVGLANGLVVTGLLTPEEAGWPPGARADALCRLPDAELVTLSVIRLEALGKTLRRIDQDNEQTMALWENLG
ncbi:hypothetical protein IV498_01420 [Paenarthrobacter sp. Z7-10]|uniref:hypothetical protein n=1 Tax=Paenarthrobacter sp. Z7-10 TaxID=2787635 RepID=UPI0022A9C633|nr:hypothetical protein [Paenarthrobacter sp. Z7-10]MCZ2401874.1 hypothetical protein [Paenarthrobacter sp. Z7-10]